jgi:8-oxo-dGTP diphosphatase
VKIQQVFKTYDYLHPSTVEKLCFCLRCGSKCLTRPENGIPRLTCPNCGYIYYQNPAPVVSVLIEKDGRCLLCRRSAGNYFQAGKWCLPCGFIEFNEDYLSSAVREIREETGLEIEVQSIISVVSNFFAPDLHTLAVVLSARPTGGDLKIGDNENDLLEWFSAKEGLPEMAFEADTHIIQRYFTTRLTGAPVDTDYSKQGQ